jgi:hypothetical protein
MAKQHHGIHRKGRRWAVRREDGPDEGDEHLASFSTKKEAEKQVRRLKEYWERGMGERR